MTNQPNYSEIWLVRFPFSDLTSIKLRPALVMARHRQEFIILGIFSKIPSSDLRDTWVLLPGNYTDFSETGLKKTSLIRGDKIATVDESVFHKKLGVLPAPILVSVKQALKKSLNLT